MSGTLHFQKDGSQIDGLLFGPLQFQAIASGIGMSQSHPKAGDHSSFLDVSNAQVVLQKNSGLLQFFLQGGLYSTPSLGTTYQKARQQSTDSFGLIPLASVAIVPSKNLILSAGKLNSIGGYENTFTFQNINIDRGLLWNQTSNVSRGVELDYSKGGLTSAISWNDGFYSGKMTWISANIGYKFTEANQVTFSGAGNLSATSVDTFVTPLLQNNSQIYNAIYIHDEDRFSIAPYLQYSVVPANPSIGILNRSDSKGAAILFNYKLSSEFGASFSSVGKVYFPIRIEYINSNGGTPSNGGSLLYGPNSSAWSFTITPTYQAGKYFVRGEISSVKILNLTAGQGFGAQGINSNQLRAMIEVGGLF